VINAGAGPGIFAICGDTISTISGRCADGTEEQTFVGGMVDVLAP